MQREILFRGKKHRGGWAYGSLIVAEEFCCILEDEANVHPMDYPYFDGELGVIDGHVTPVVPETVGQWTGLVDKNGIKIFEGDIMRGYGQIRSVIYDVKHAEFEFDSNDPVYNPDGMTLFFDCEYSEIIGNVYDNTELLEKERR